MNKKYDMVVKVGEYQSNGVTKARWKTIGSVMDDGKGGMFAFLDRHFNPAGVPFKEGSEAIIVSLFEPKPTSDRTTHQGPPKTDTNAITDEEIPF